MCKLGGMNSKFGQKFLFLTVTRVTGHVHGIFSKKLEFGPKKCFISKRSSYGTKKSIMTFYHDLSNFCYGLFSHFWPKLKLFWVFLSLSVSITRHEILSKIVCIGMNLHLQSIWVWLCTTIHVSLQYLQLYKSKIKVLDDVFVCIEKCYFSMILPNIINDE